MEIAYKYIQRFQVVRMWGRINLHWADLNNDVNILVGINGALNAGILAVQMLAVGDEQIQEIGRAHV